MDDLIGALGGTPIPTILVIAGLFFLFVAIGGQFGAKIVTDKVKQRYAALVGIALIVVGLLIFLCARIPREGEKDGKEVGPGPEIPEHPVEPVESHPGQEEYLPEQPGGIEVPQPEHWGG